MFYTLPLSGDHPAAFPLVVSTGSEEPITILADAVTTVFSSFISSSLVEDLGRTSQIKAVVEESRFLPERNISGLLGFKSEIIGQLSLDIIAGKDDRMIQNTNFTVFRAPEISGKQTAGVWRPDLIVGMDFLNDIQGLRLTEEYSGSVAAGAKEGLPVLVQKVYEWGVQKKCARCKMEDEERVQRDEL